MHVVIKRLYTVAWWLFAAAWSIVFLLTALGLAANPISMSLLVIIGMVINFGLFLAALPVLLVVHFVAIGRWSWSWRW